MWYVVQIMTGKEEEIQSVIEKVLEPECYENCFYIKRERVWRRDGKCIIHIEPLFPGYLFVSTDRPGELFICLKKIPQFTKLLKMPEKEFLSVAPEEQEFLMHLVNNDPEYIVRLSEVEVDADKNIIAVVGPLKWYVDMIVKKKMRLRYVVVRVRLLGELRDVLVGIKVKTPGVS